MLFCLHDHAEIWNINVSTVLTCILRAKEEHFTVCITCSCMYIISDIDYFVPPLFAQKPV